MLVAANVVVTLFAAEDPMVGGASLYRTREIMQKPMNWNDALVLVAAAPADTIEAKERSKNFQASMRD